MASRKQSIGKTLKSTGGPIMSPSGLNVGGATDYWTNDRMKQAKPMERFSPTPGERAPTPMEHFSPTPGAKPPGKKPGARPPVGGGTHSVYPTVPYLPTPGAKPPGKKPGARPPVGGGTYSVYPTVPYLPTPGAKPPGKKPGAKSPNDVVVSASPNQPQPSGMPNVKPWPRPTMTDAAWGTQRRGGRSR